MITRALIVAAVSVAAGAGSFFLGRGTAAPSAAGPASAPAGPGRGATCCGHAALCNWLHLSADQRKQVRQTDPKFGDEAGALRAETDKDRRALSALLEDPNSTDEQITAQVERVIASHDALERRVARHLLALRKLLTVQQAKQLMGLAASGVRQAGLGWQSGPLGRGDDGAGRGAGFGAGTGPGRGRGGGFRGGR